MTVIVSTTNNHAHISLYGTTIGFARVSRIQGKREWDGNGKWEQGDLRKMPDKGHHAIYILE